VVEQGKGNKKGQVKCDKKGARKAVKSTRELVKRDG
jgi:hypothetical protein